MGVRSLPDTKSVSLFERGKFSISFSIQRKVWRTLTNNKFDEMCRIKNSIILLVFVAIQNGAIAQSAADSIRKGNVHTKIALTDILGEWYMHHPDSSKSKIHFINEASYHVIIPEIKHGVGEYSFRIEQDSMYVNGYAPNWPPYYCTVNRVDNNTLELLFYTYTNAFTTSVVCRRERKH